MSLRSVGAVVSLAGLIISTNGAKQVVSNSGSFDFSNILNDKNSVPTINPSGFVSAKLNRTPFTMKIANRINRPGFCNKLKFQNIPEPNSSPFVGPPEFLLNVDELHNGHFSWTNGNEVLSYIQYPDSDYGNWLIGSVAGVDSGYVFLKTTEKGFTPLNHETDTNHWQWLMEGKWVGVPEMRAVCADSFQSDPFYYEIEYFDLETHEVQHSILMEGINSYVFARQDFLANTAVSEDEYLQDSIAEGVTAFLDRSTAKWVALEDLTSIASFGSPVTVTETKGDKSSSAALLVKDEHGGNNRWRLTFRQYPTTPIPAASKKVVDPYVQQQNEYLVEVSSAGIVDHTIAPLNSKLEKAYQSTLFNSLSDIRMGDYVWMWYANTMQTKELSAQVSEILLKCVAQTAVNGTVVSAFEYYETDRQDVLRQTVLSRDTDLLVLTTYTPSAANLKAGRFTPPSVQFKNRAVQLQSLVRIGPDVLRFLRTHLVNKEGRPNGMSSCYLYHAAVSMPQVLVYAAEIMCVLMGAKPVTMIQYTSPTEHQWKFPLVRELSQAIIAQKTLLGAALDVDFQVYKYGNDESLIIYHKEREYVAEGLVPHGKQAQALHPLPYPDSSRLTQDHKLQIYNSAWNGLMLGYPDYFVDSYCDTFHNALDLTEKRKQARAAKADFKSYMTKIRKEPLTIHMGLDAPINEKHFDLIVDAATGTNRGRKE